MLTFFNCIIWKANHKKFKSPISINFYCNGYGIYTNNGTSKRFYKH